MSDLNCAAHIDSDSIAHAVYIPGSDAIKDVVKEFGSDLLLSNGELDRKKLGAIVFANSTAMQRLEQIVWPHVQTEIESAIAEARNNWIETVGKTPAIVIEAAMLLDAGWQHFMDGVWVVSASRNVALDRLQMNRGLTRDEAESRIVAQLPRRGIGNLQDEVASRAVTAVIVNDGTVEDLKLQLLKKLNDPNAWY